MGEIGDFVGIHVVFDRDAFVSDSGLDDPNCFLRHSNASERRYPLIYVARFHRGALNEFFEDTVAWFEASR